MAEGGLASEGLVKPAEIKNGLLVEHKPGEPAGIRKVNFEDESDMDRMWQIEKSGGIVEIGGAAEDKKAVREWVKKLNQSENISLFGVAAMEGADKKQLGEVEGWVRLDQTEEEAERYQRVTGKKAGKGFFSPIEAAYIRRPDKKMPKGLVASGLRQVCLKLGDQEAEWRVKNSQQEESIQRRVVTAFVDQTNLKSIKLLEECGFKKVKERVKWQVEDDYWCDMYLLDWDKLDETEEEKTQAEVRSEFPSLKDSEIVKK